MRIDEYEFRRLENRDAEIVTWVEREGEKPYCYTVAFFKKRTEGYDLESVGDRIARVYDYGKFHALMKYAFRVLDAEFDLLDVWG